MYRPSVNKEFTALISDVKQAVLFKITLGYINREFAIFLKN